MKTEEQSSMGHKGSPYVVLVVKVTEIRSGNIMTTSSLEDYEENVIS